MKKNNEIQLNIMDMTAEGNGIGRFEGQAVFVPHTAVGDEVKVKIIKTAKNYAVGRLMELTKSADCRISPDCPVCGPCGGCTYRHITYEAECEIKKKRVNDCLARIGGLDVQVEEIIPSPKVDGYRNKAQFPVGLDADGQPILGFYAPRSHRIVKTEGCQLQPAVFDRLCQAFLTYMKEQKVSVYDPQKGTGMVRHFYLRMGFATGQVMACVVIGKGNLPHRERLVALLKEAHPEITGILVNRNPKPTNVILGEETVCIDGKDTIDDVLMDVPFTLSLHSFYQVNPAAVEKLFTRAADYAAVGDGDTVVDLYCGAGAVGFCAGKQAGKLIGVEIVPQAVENAKQNAKRIGRENCEFMCMDAAEAAKELARRGVKPDVVFVDPPRKGCDQSVLQTIANDFAPKRVVYISCDPATLARDAAIFKDLGYHMEKATAVDLFPRTPHVETVALLRRQINVHQMKLQSVPFEMIKSGEKTIELRLNDEKRQHIKIGDKIVFTNTANRETLNTTVAKLHRFNSFDELYKSLPLLQCGYTSENVDKATPSDMEQYYSLEEQKKYGVVGIELCRQK